MVVGSMESFPAALWAEAELSVAVARALPFRRQKEKDEHREVITRMQAQKAERLRHFLFHCFNGDA